MHSYSHLESFLFLGEILQEKHDANLFEDPLSKAPKPSRGSNQRPWSCPYSAYKVERKVLIGCDGRPAKE